MVRRSGSRTGTRAAARPAGTRRSRAEPGTGRGRGAIRGTCATAGTGQRVKRGGTDTSTGMTRRFVHTASADRDRQILPYIPGMQPTVRDACNSRTSQTPCAAKCHAPGAERERMRLRR